VEVEVAARMAEPPRHRVVATCGLGCGLEHPED
jgi:hypothetical protein